MSILSKAEESALRYYIGDVSGNNPFYGDPKAYVLLNSLFYPNIISETARAFEGKYLNPAIIADTSRLMGFFESLFSAFGKADLSISQTTFRVERFSDFEISRKFGMTVSMTSTSIAGFLNSYRDRQGIALMKFELPENGHFINVAEMLGYYAKPEEAEILIPPFMELEFEQLQLTEKEKLITDCNGNAPIISVKTKINKLAVLESSNEKISPCPEGIRVCEALNAKKQPDAEDIQIYSEWKKILCKRLYKMLYSIFSQ